MDLVNCLPDEDNCKLEHDKLGWQASPVRLTNSGCDNVAEWLAMGKTINRKSRTRRYTSGESLALLP
jgi:hypothetical protein